MILMLLSSGRDKSISDIDEAVVVLLNVLEGCVFRADTVRISWEAVVFLGDHVADDSFNTLYSYILARP